MKIRTFGYFIRQAFQSLNRNAWLGLASVGTMAVSLIIVGISMIIVMNTNYMAASLEANVEIIAYLKDEITLEQAAELNDQIKDIPGIAEVDFVTKEEAMTEFRKELGDQKNMIDALGGSNPLPNLFKITTIAPQDVEKVANGLQAMPEMEKVDYGKGVVEKLFSITKWVRIAGVVVVALLGLAAVFLIATTIRLTVFARRKEIEIMRVLGATNWFIRFPFLLEGTVLGTTGATLAVGVVFGLYTAFNNYVIQELNFNMLGLHADYRMMLMMGGGMLVFGAFLGALGSGISMRRFLKI